MENTYREAKLLDYRKKLNAYKRELQEVRALRPDYENLIGKSATAVDEVRKMEMNEFRLVQKTKELEELIMDLETENDDQTPA